MTNGWLPLNSILDIGQMYFDGLDSDFWSPDAWLVEYWGLGVKMQFFTSFNPRIWEYKAETRFSIRADSRASLLNRFPSSQATIGSDKSSDEMAQWQLLQNQNEKTFKNNYYYEEEEEEEEYNTIYSCMSINTKANNESRTAYNDNMFVHNM